MEFSVVGLNELENRIGNLSPIDEKLSREEIHRLFVKELQKLFGPREVAPVLRHRFSPVVESDTDIAFYRISAFKGLDRYNYKHFSNPPQELTTRGRCNLPKFPVFYCSNSGYTSLIEFLNGKPGSKNEELFLSEWVINKVICEWKALSFILSGLPAENDLYTFGQDMVDKGKSVLNSYIDRRLTGDYIDFYHKAFTSLSHFYPSLMAHLFLYVDNQDMIMYPSIANNKADFNYALRPELVDSRMYLSRIFSFKINGDNFRNEKSWNLTGIAKRDVTGILYWCIPTARDEIAFKEAMLMESD